MLTIRVTSTQRFVSLELDGWLKDESGVLRFLSLPGAWFPQPIKKCIFFQSCFDRPNKTAITKYSYHILVIITFRKPLETDTGVSGLKIKTKEAELNLAPAQHHSRPRTKRGHR